MTDDGPAQAVFRYHERTKHHLHRYARGPGGLDWENQPNPFRIYTGAPRVRLPLPPTVPEAPHPALYRGGPTTTQPVNRDSLGSLLALSLGLSAWKASGASRWSLRVNPSSGNLHPTEAYLAVPPGTDMPGGVYHYAPLLHVLEHRATLSDEAWIRHDRYFQGDGILLALTSIFWRESWKYGERALRYCFLDAGHALAAVSISAGLLGWRVHLMDGTGGLDICRLLGLDRTVYPDCEGEHADLICRIQPAGAPSPPGSLPDAFTAAAIRSEIAGIPAPLSPSHVDWKIIADTAAMVSAAPSHGDAVVLPAHCGRASSPSALSAADIIRRRRSATAFDPSAVMERNRFLSILEKTLPVRDGRPFDIGAGRPGVHLLLFVHRVTDMAAGMYLLCRWEADLQDLKQALDPGFLWQPADGALPLYLLLENDVRADAIQASCHQEIAGFSHFSLGMLARFEDMIAAAPSVYPKLFRECGMIGQVLYLEAEAQGVRGTGIGCFFDDTVHALAGLKTNRFQSLYHFTVGTPSADPRLATLAAYHHLEGEGRR